MLVEDVFSYEACCTTIHEMWQASKDGVNVEIKEVKEGRSNLQNRFYWATVGDISKFMIGAGAYYELQGVRLEYTPDMVHEINKGMFSILSTVNLSKKEFIDYMDSVNSFWRQRTNGNYMPTKNARSI